MLFRSCALMLLLIVPLGCGDLSSPPISAEPNWDSPRTRELAERACFQCHSNETEWTWYHHLPVASAMFGGEVALARTKLNFSEWDRPQDDAADAAEVILDQEMPPSAFLFAYPHRGLTDEERNELAAGLAATFENDPPAGD